MRQTAGGTWGSHLVEPSSLLHFALGLALLVGGADLLVRGSSRLAAALGVTPLVIGLTVVAYGTSTPELTVSLQSGLLGQADIAVANVVGSNIANVLLILGASTLILPIVVAQSLVRREVPLMLGSSALVYGLAIDGGLGRLDGAIHFLGIVAYTNYGGRWLVDSALAIAAALGVPEVVVGLTIVAVGTSMPELATSLLASFRGERDIAVGNVIGSNIYNLLGILGLCALVTPGGLVVSPSILAFDLPVMTAVAFSCLPIFFTGFRIDRWEGALFLA